MVIIMSLTILDSLQFVKMKIGAVQRDALPVVFRIPMT